MEGKFVSLRRANGETFYFNISAINMIHDNPENKTITITGAGFEKVFFPTDAATVLDMVRKQTVNAEILNRPVVGG